MKEMHGRWKTIWEADARECSTGRYQCRKYGGRRLSRPSQDCSAGVQTLSLEEHRWP